MIDRHDEHELLALVEGELSPQQETRLRARLATSDPQALLVLDRMRADRDALRRTPELALPEDFLAEVEPVLARPMLIPPPDEVRRRHRRRQAGRRRRAPILLAAAALAVVVGAAIWATAFLLGRLADTGTGSVVPRADQPLAHRDTPTTAPAVVAPNPRATQPAPEMRAERPAEARPPPRSPIGPTSPAAAPPSAPVVASIALVIEAGDPDEAERLLQAMLAGIDPTTTALVRNLDQAEADAITDQWHQARARGGTRGVEPPVAEAGNGPAPRRAPDPGLRPAPIDRSILRSRQLAGPAELAPSYEQQLAFSGQGATHTIAVPADKLAALLESLARDGRATTLRLLDRAAPADASWGAYADVRRAAAELLERARGGVILLPVEVRPGR